MKLKTIIWIVLALLLLATIVYLIFGVDTSQSFIPESSITISGGGGGGII